MGIEYCHCLIPRPNSYRPTPTELADLVHALAVENWIPAPDTESFAKMAAIDGESVIDAAETWAHSRLCRGYGKIPYPLTVDWFKSREDCDLRIGFPIEHADKIGLQYPLMCDGGLPEDPYYEIELHLSRQFVHRASELIDPINAICKCGESLEEDINHDDDVFLAPRVKLQCSRCGAEFDPSQADVMVRDGWDNSTTIVKGGAVYRFAIVIDCGKCIPNRKADPIVANPRLVELCERLLGHPFYEIGDIY